MISRRGLFVGAASAAGVILAAPSIVRAASLMPVSVLDRPMPATEALRLQQAWLRHVTRFTVDGAVRVPPSEWHRLLSDDLVHRLESVPLK